MISAKGNQIILRIKQALLPARGKGASAILIGSFLMKIAGFLGSIVLVRIMSKEDYGVLSFIENRYTYIYLLAGFGLNNAVFRYIVLAESDSERKAVFKFDIVTGTRINLILVLVAIILSSILPTSDEFTLGTELLPLMLLALPLQFLFDTCTYSLRALFKNRLFAIVALCSVVMVWSSKVVGARFAGLTGAILSWPISYAVIAVLLLLYFQFNVFWQTKAGMLDKKKKKEMFVYSAQYMITNGLWAAFHQNDMLLIGILAGQATALADYKVAYAIPAALSILSSSIGTFVAPYFVKNENNASWVWRNYQRVIGASVLSIGGVAGLLALMGPIVVRFVYGEHYMSAVPIMVTLLIASILNNGLRYPTANILSAMGKVRINMLISICGMAFQLFFSIALIPRFGSLGAAASSVIVYGMMAVFEVMYFCKTFGVKH